MGAAVAIHAAKQPGIASDLSGIIAIDVVEGTAIQSLSTMTSILQQRPSGFVSLEEAIEWALRSGTSRNRSSACISIPGMLIQSNDIFFEDKNTVPRSQAEKWADQVIIYLLSFYSFILSFFYSFILLSFLTFIFVLYLICLILLFVGYPIFE